MASEVKPYKNTNIFFLAGRPFLVKELFKFDAALSCSFIDVPDFFKRFVKKDHKEVDLSNYSVWRRAGFTPLETGTGRGITNILPDTNYQFILKHERETIAALGFEASEKGVLISQIQGVKCKQDSLKPLKWPNTLINVVLEWAPKARLSEVLILPSAKNQWELVKQNVEGAKLYYDVAAKKEGFQYDQERKVYVKQINRSGLLSRFFHH